MPNNNPLAKIQLMDFQRRKRSDAQPQSRPKGIYTPRSHSQAPSQASRRSQYPHQTQHARVNVATASHYSRHNDGSYRAISTKKRRNRHILAAVLIILFLVCGVGGGVAWAYLNAINHNLSQGISPDIDTVLAPKNVSSEPFYILLLGTDGSLERDETNETEGSYRTDSIVLARIDPKSKQATLVSIPRDTMIKDLAGYGPQKINAAYTFGGAKLAVSTVSELAGVDISHFALIDMDGLSTIIDALGGIEVDVSYTIDDADAGGHVDAGYQTLDGEHALILARARHCFDDVGDGDTYRAANQRLVLSAIAHKILSSDAATIASTINKLSNAVQTDMSVEEIIRIAQSLRGMDTENDLYSASMPYEPAYINEIWYVLCLYDEWADMMQRVNSGLPPTDETIVDEATGIALSNAGSAAGASQESSGSGSSGAAGKGGSIYVRNGGAASGSAAAVSKALSEAGYNVVDTGNADSSDYKTTIVIYNDTAYAAEAKEIATTIGHGAAAQENDGTYNMLGDFLIVVGRSY